VRYTMKHKTPENQSNTMNSTWKNEMQWNAMNISEEKTMNTLKLKQIKNIQKNNVNGWQSLENYRKSKNTMKTWKPEGAILKKQRKDNATHWKRIKKQWWTIYCTKQWKTWKSQENNEK
jgi:hypothetical protein